MAAWISSLSAGMVTFRFERLMTIRPPLSNLSEHRLHSSPKAPRGRSFSDDPFVCLQDAERGCVSGTITPPEGKGPEVFPPLFRFWSFMQLRGTRGDEHWHFRSRCSRLGSSLAVTRCLLGG